MKDKILQVLLLLSASPLLVADEAQSATHGGMSSMIMFGALFVMMYFLMIRPQSKRAKEHRSLLSSLGQGDEVVTQGGLVGVIARDAGTFFVLTLSQGVEVRVQKQSVVQQLPKGTLQSI